MRGVYVVLGILIISGCGVDSGETIIGVWSMTENISEQVLELEFRPDGVIRQTLAHETNIGQYMLTDEGEHRELLITWSNGSQVSIWVQFSGNNHMKFYDKADEEAPDFTRAFELGTLTRLEAS